MEVQPTRPNGIDTDVRAEKTRGAHERFAGSHGDAPKSGATRSDANTRLSREPDSVELSDEARELSRREANEAARREAQEHKQQAKEREHGQGHAHHEG